MIKQCICVAIAIYLHTGTVLAQTDPDDARIQALEQQLLTAQDNLAALRDTMDVLALELANIRGSNTRTAAGAEAEQMRENIDNSASTYSERIVVSDLGHDERDDELQPRPELFVQSRFHANPIDGATTSDAARNFGLSRVEIRWAGRVSDNVGVGYEIQYHPAPDGSAEELVNDAYVEYYAGEKNTIRAGQFVKPFGFDIQHSSSARESPERGIFAGYFFPGQRDRGLMLTTDIGDLAPWAKGMTLYTGVFNGNRFFDDNNTALNFNFRARKVFDFLPLAIGASIQRGTQALPPGAGDNGDEDVYGIDFQYQVGRLGMRAEFARGDTPSTLLGIEPVFALGFVAGSKSRSATAFFNYQLSSADDFYWRWDKFSTDPVTRRDIRAFNLGYLRNIGSNSRIGIDYQRKSSVSFNDDELNNALSISWNVLY
jgi:hypothetical protein